MNFKETLAEKTVHAEDVLTKYLPEEKGYQKKVIESMNYSALAGGKRLRPILMTSLTTVRHHTGASSVMYRTLSHLCCVLTRFMIKRFIRNANSALPYGVLLLFPAI